jgi:hypothetical protein
MAHRFYGLNRGQTEFDVVDAATTQTKDIEVNIDLSKGLEKVEIAVKLDEIKNAIMKDASNVLG